MRRLREQLHARGADEGVGTIAQAALAAYPKLLREHLGIGEDRLVVCGISFGYPDDAHAANKFRTTRADPRSAATFVE